MAVILLIWLCISAVCDAIYKKCFNWIVVFGGLSALFSLMIDQIPLPVKTGFVDGFIGFFVAFFVLLVFYKIKMMGAGDVKFAAVLGFWIGWQPLLFIWALSCFFAVLHGVIVKSRFSYFFSTVFKSDFGIYGRNVKFIPYVTYMSMATVIVLMLNK